MSDGDSKAENAASKPEPTVDEVLIAIQKTLSRVSRDSANISPDQARSLITGEVGFSIKLKASMSATKLYQDTSGPIDLELSGKVMADVDIAPTPTHDKRGG